MRRVQHDSNVLLNNSKESHVPFGKFHVGVENFQPLQIVAKGYQVKLILMKNYVRILLKYRIAILICIMGATAFFSHYAVKTNTDNSIEIWLSKNDRELDYYKSFLHRFGDEEFLVVAFSAANIFTKEKLREINTVADKLRQMTGIVQVTSLADVYKDKISSPPFREKAKSSYERPLLKIFKHELLADSAYQNNIISKNGKTTAIIATVRCAGPESRKQLVSAVRKLFHETTGKTENRKKQPVKYHIAGPSVVNAELDRMAKQDMATFTPIMFIISLVVLGCLFRNIAGILIPLLTIGACVIWVTGCYVLFGQTMNMVSNMLLPLTFIIALSTSIHIVRQYYHETSLCQVRKNTQDNKASASHASHNGKYLHGNIHEEAIHRTLKDVGIPILMTSITTAIGFASLMTSDIPPIFTTGLFMCGCAALTFCISMTLIPILLSFIPPKTAAPENSSNSKKSFLERLAKGQNLNAFLTRLSQFTVKQRKSILLSGFIIGLTCLWGVSQLRVESDIMNSFPKTSRIAKDNAYIEKRLMGLLPIEIVAESTYGHSILEPDALNNLVRLQNHLSGIPEVTNSLSVANYIQKTHQILHGNKLEYYAIPDTAKEASNYIKLTSVYGDKFINSLYTKDHANARISVRIKQIGSNRYKAIITSIKEYIQKHLHTSLLTWHITGIVPLLINVQDNILMSEIRSFSLAFLLTFISTAVALQSVKIGLISIIPNLLPITITLGVMGFAGIGLDASTIMIASIALGISVDNTIHIFHRFKSELSVDGNHANAIHRTLHGVGKTAIFTSLSAIFGFMVFSFSHFKPVQYFGILTCVTMLNAIVSDLFISPCCLAVFKSHFHRMHKITNV